MFAFVSLNCLALAAFIGAAALGVSFTVNILVIMGLCMPVLWNLISDWQQGEKLW
jgi:hypothetical protein